MNSGELKLGDRVILSRVKRPEFIGQHGTVKRIFKTRPGEVYIRLDDGRRYDAVIGNIDKESNP